jgi:hypothetical protein
MSVEERFFKYVVPDGDCWRWTGVFGTNKYGQFGIGYSKYQAHRVSYILHKGDIPEGLEVCHLCVKHRWCVNPDHLIVDTHGANMKMMIEQGQSTKGSKNPMSKLTEEEINDIKNKSKMISARQLAKEYNVAHTTILNIINQKTWSHI